MRRRAAAIFTLPFVFSLVLVAGVTGFISFVLWPTWPSTPVPIDAPAIPVAVAGVLFNVPPAAIRESVQRRPGQQERLDLAFAWPSLGPPTSEPKSGGKPALNAENAVAAATESASDRLFVTIGPLGPVLPPLERLRTIYPRYVEATASAGADGLAVLPFRSGTPYDGEDLVYVGAEPEKFFARCSRAGAAVPGTCIAERLVGTAEISFRFPRDWLNDWRGVATRFDTLLARLHPPPGGGK